MKTAHRVTLTLPVLNSARHVAFLVAGEGKRQPLADVWTGCSRLPAARVRPVESALLWLVDRAAAGA
jgi:6-phosphogluconolactonase